MTFEVDFVQNLVTLGVLKISISNLIEYCAILVGAAIHYWKLSKLVDEQIKQNNIKEKDSSLLREDVKRNFIKEKSKVYFEKMEKLAAATEGKFDDKLFLYLRVLKRAFKTTFGDNPTDEEIKDMTDRAEALAYQDKVRKGKVK